MHSGLGEAGVKPISSIPCVGHHHRLHLHRRCRGRGQGRGRSIADYPVQWSCIRRLMSTTLKTSLRPIAETSLAPGCAAAPDSTAAGGGRARSSSKARSRDQHTFHALSVRECRRAADAGQGSKRSSAQSRARTSASQSPQAHLEATLRSTSPPDSVDGGCVPLDAALLRRRAICRHASTSTTSDHGGVLRSSGDGRSRAARHRDRRQLFPGREPRIGRALGYSGTSRATVSRTTWALSATDELRIARTTAKTHVSCSA